jgi:hypothetical protein
VSELRRLPYRSYLCTPVWRRTRAAALLRAGHRCALDLTHTDDLDAPARARCEVRHAGRLSAVLPEAPRLVMIKSDGSVMVHADTGGYTPQN